MDPTTAFVHHFCNETARMAHSYRQMADWYIFSDKRPGSLTERFEADAADYADYRRMFQI